MGILSSLFGTNQTIVTSKISFDERRTHGKISVNPGYDIEPSMHLLVLFQISKMLCIVPRNYSYTKEFIKTYFDVCDESYTSDSTRFKSALQNKYEGKLRYFFSPPENPIEIFESELSITSDKSFNFNTKIPIIGGRTDAALSTPLVLLAIILDSGNSSTVIKTQKSVRSMCEKYLNGYDWTSPSSIYELPIKTFGENK